MRIQISSGQWPDECELAVGKLLNELLREFPSLTVIEQTIGRRSGCIKSALLESDDDLSFLEGTVKWKCVSPYRPKHKRKNWFVDISICDEIKQIDFNQELVRFETFRSRGKGGQNINKVETGVRAIYIPTGLAVVSTEARTQHMNKRIALDRLCMMIAQANFQNTEELKALRWIEHTRLERGNAVRVYECMEFKRIL